MKVLLADDNITAQRMGSKILSEAGYSVVAVSNGAAAVKKIASEKPELIILDVYMPGYSGLEVCEKVKSAVETMRVPVVLTVTNMEPFNPSDGNRVKADGVLVKPFEATDLLSLVRKFEEKMQSPESFVDRTAKTGISEEFPEVVMPEPAPKKSDLPEEIANAPALGLEELEAAPLATRLSESAEPPSAFVPEVVAPLEDLNVVPPPAELEINCQQVGEVEVAPASELQPTLQESGAEFTIAQDPALATDPSDFSEFVTKFGQENPEDIPVGIAMEEPVEAAATEEAKEEADILESAEPELVVEEATNDAGLQEQEQAADHAEAEHDHPLVMDEATREHDEDEHQDRIFELEPTMHDAAIAEIQSLIGEFMQHQSDTGFTFAKPAQVIEASVSAVATAPEPEAETGVDTQPVDVWPEMHPAELAQEPEARTYEAHAESGEVAPVGFDTKKLESYATAAVEEAPAEVGVDTQTIEVLTEGSTEPVTESEHQPEPKHEDVLDSAAIVNRLVANLTAEIDTAAMDPEPAEPVSEAQEEPLESVEAAVPAPVMDENRVAAAVNSVLDRYKGELIAAIVRELKH